MIAGRAKVIQNNWGAEKGSMVAIEADITDLENLLTKSNKSLGNTNALSVACYNGPRSFTLAGSVEAIQVAESLVRSENSLANIKLKKLNVTNAFHSALVEPLMKDLELLGREIAINEPDIQLERATEQKSKGNLDAHFIANHLRTPVFFNHAVQRLAKQYPAAIWLEAGSNSTITSMANRAHNSPSLSHFQAVNITSNNSFDFLVDSTMRLWKEGVKVSFWAHHPIQTPEYTPIILPPYQFEKSRHWMELKKPRKVDVPIVSHAQSTEQPKGLTTFLGYRDKENHSARFRVNIHTQKFDQLISAHIMASTAAVCPAVFQLDIVIDALMGLRSEFQGTSFQPQLHGMKNYKPLVVDDSKLVFIDAESINVDGLVWDWKILTSLEQGQPPTCYSSGTIVFQRIADLELNEEFERFERMVGYF